MGDLVTIAEVEGHMADYFQSVLESHGITVFVENRNTSTMLPHLIIPARLQVPEDQVEAALEILDAMPENEDEEDIDFDED